jgi:GNAT superfamily N-acetyltransferase
MNVLDFYRQFGPNTDPGEYVDLYDGLPESLADLCALIKCQFIHPGSLGKFRKELPPGAQSEDAKFISVRQTLAGLKDRNRAGLVMARPPRQRLLVSCRNHALLLASIMKHRGVPARVRVGFAEYVSDRKGKYVDHWICEVWHEGEQRWMFVDPDTQMVDFPREQFKLAGDVWLAARRGFTDPKLYGVWRWWGYDQIRQNLIHDFGACLGVEPSYWEGPPLFHIEYRRSKQSQLQLLDTTAELLRDVDGNLAQLQTLRQENEPLQGSRNTRWAPATSGTAVPTPAHSQPQTLATADSSLCFCIERARPEDAKALALVSWKAFDHDVNYGAPVKGGPPGYNSDKWQVRMMQAGAYYKVMVDGRIIGGALVLEYGGGHADLGRIFIHPDYQNQGIGRRVLAYLEEAYPHVTRWTLGTPAWNQRNRHFYEGVGYKIVSDNGTGIILFEKRKALLPG